MRLSRVRPRSIPALYEHKEYLNVGQPVGPANASERKYIRLEECPITSPYTGFEFPAVEVLPWMEGMEKIGKR
jgi:hypothetical protein